MRLRLVVLRPALLLGVALMALSARAPSRPSTTPLADWIVSLQTLDPASPAHGAVVLHSDPAFYAGGEAYRHVVPYFANLAVAALLDVEASPRSRRVAERYADWTLAATGPAGVPVEHWVAPSGAVTTCPRDLDATPRQTRCEAIDATDSAASTFLVVVEAYLRAGGDPAFVRDRREGVRAMARTLLDLQDADGLTLAREDYAVKYLMDNAETVAGLRAMAALEAEVLGGDAARYRTAAGHAARGLATLLDAETGLYAWARLPDGTDEASRLDRWYADAVAQVWPLLFEAVPSRSASSSYWRLDAAWGGNALPDWTAHRDASGFSWPALGVAASSAGDVASARTQVDVLWQRHAAASRPFASPFTVADAGWLLRAVAAVEGLGM